MVDYCLFSSFDAQDLMQPIGLQHDWVAMVGPGAEIPQQDGNQIPRIFSARLLNLPVETSVESVLMSV